MGVAVDGGHARLGAAELHPGLERVLELLEEPVMPSLVLQDQADEVPDRPGIRGLGERLVLREHALLGRDVRHEVVVYLLFPRAGVNGQWRHHDVLLVWWSVSENGPAGSHSGGPKVPIAGGRRPLAASTPVGHPPGRK